MIGRQVSGGRSTILGLQATLREGGTAAQVFPAGRLTRSPCAATSETIDSLGEVRKITAGRTPTVHLITHGAYTLTATTPLDCPAAMWALKGVVKSLQWTEAVDGRAMVIHAGSTKHGDWYRNARVFLRSAMRHYDGPVSLLLETMAGRTSFGEDVDVLAELVTEASRSPNVRGRLGICVDTTHSWSAGYSIGAIAQLTERYPDLIRACHLNAPNQDISRGCRRDKHHVTIPTSAWHGDNGFPMRYLYEVYGRGLNVPCILEGTPDPVGDYSITLDTGQESLKNLGQYSSHLTASAGPGLSQAGRG